MGISVVIILLANVRNTRTFIGEYNESAWGKQRDRTICPVIAMLQSDPAINSFVLWDCVLPFIVPQLFRHSIFGHAIELLYGPCSTAFVSIEGRTNRNVQGL